ncbi:MAG: hydrolase, partial [Dysgonamonadaceae bacterium]|nr:hydrolase [Dysgonamonadaceae bacterium]
MKKNINLPVYIYFAVAIILIIVLFPREGKFRYSFVQGKPWQYGLLTASFDFPVYKSPEQLKLEKDSVMNNFTPYFQLDTDAYSKQLERFNADYMHYDKKYWK